MSPPARVKIWARQIDAVWESESFGVRRDLARPDDGKSGPANCDELGAERDDQAVHRGSRNNEPFGAPRAPAETGHSGRRLPGAGPFGWSVVFIKHGRSPSSRVERLRPAQSPGAEWRRWWQWRKESAPVRARQGHRCRVPSLRGRDPGEWSGSDDESPEAAVSANQAVSARNEYQRQNDSPRAGAPGASACAIPRLWIAPNLQTATLAYSGLAKKSVPQTSTAPRCPTVITKSPVAHTRTRSRHVFP